MLKIGLFILICLNFSCSHFQNDVEQKRSLSNTNDSNQINWDRFTPTEFMPSVGEFQNQKVETKMRRALIFLTYQEKVNLKIPTDQLAFANFRHAKTFYLASIPGIKVDENNKLVSMNSVIEKVIFSKKHWAEKIRKATRSVEIHSELSFFLNKNSLLTLWYDQDKRIQLNKPKSLNESVVYTIEAVRSADSEDAGFFPAALGPHFAIAYRVISNTERNIQHLGDPDRKITSNALTFTNTKSKNAIIESPMDALFYHILNESQKNQRQQIYQALLNNCTNNLFIAIDNSVSYIKNIDLKYLKSEIKKYNRKELPEIISYLKQQQIAASDQNMKLNSDLDMLITELIKYNENQIDQLEVGENFMYSFPGFIDSHLKSRGLIAK